jgi:predicted dehydrogenase
MSRTWSLAMIGLGGFSTAHAKAYSLLPEVRIVAACDNNPDKHA